MSGFAGSSVLLISAGTVYWVAITVDDADDCTLVELPWERIVFSTSLTALSKTSSSLESSESKFTKTYKFCFHCYIWLDGSRGAGGGYECVEKKYIFAMINSCIKNIAVHNFVMPLAQILMSSILTNYIMSIIITSTWYKSLRCRYTNSRHGSWCARNLNSSLHSIALTYVYL